MTPTEPTNPPKPRPFLAWTNPNPNPRQYRPAPDPHKIACEIPPPDPQIEEQPQAAAAPPPACYVPMEPPAPLVPIALWFFAVMFALFVLSLMLDAC